MKRILVLGAALLAAAPALAVDKIYTPYVEKGEWEIEYFGRRTVDDDGTQNNAQEHEFSLEYSPTDWWKTEANAIFQKPADDELQFDALEWENIFQFTRPGEYWIDTGAELAYEWTPQGGDADAIEMRLLFAKHLGPTFHILNLVGEQAIGSGATDSFEAGIAWSSRYMLSPYFQPGFEFHNEFGEVNDISSFGKQEHYVGPVAYGTIPFEMEGDKVEGLGYRAGYMFGFGPSASDGQVVLQLEYELDF